MPDKQKSAQKSRSSKTSSGTARGSKPIRLTDLQKILLVNGGSAHRYLRQGKLRMTAPGVGRGRKLSSKARRDMEAA
jgi:hypothetical protein